MISLMTHILLLQFYVIPFIIIISKLQTENIKVCTINTQCFSRKTAALVYVRIIEPEV